MRNFETSRFIKTVGLTEDDHVFIQEIKDKKSMAGKVEEIIQFYRDNQHNKIYGKTKKKLRILSVKLEARRSENDGAGSQSDRNQGVS